MRAVGVIIILEISGAAMRIDIADAIGSPFTVLTLLLHFPRADVPMYYHSTVFLYVPLVRQLGIHKSRSSLEEDIGSKMKPCTDNVRSHIV